MTSYKNKKTITHIKIYGTLTLHSKLCKSFIPCVGYVD